MVSKFELPTLTMLSLRICSTRTHDLRWPGCVAGRGMRLKPTRSEIRQSKSARSIWRADDPVAVGAIRRLSSKDGELKSMFVADTARCRGRRQDSARASDRNGTKQRDDASEPGRLRTWMSELSAWLTPQTISLTLPGWHLCLTFQIVHFPATIHMSGATRAWHPSSTLHRTRWERLLRKRA